MNIVFVSNYINHHQIPLSMELYDLCKCDNGSYYFIQTQKMEQDRVEMGWQNAIKSVPFLMQYDEQNEKCQTLIDEADAVIFGGVEDITYIKNRLKKNKFVWHYSERMYKTGRYKCVSPRGLIRKFSEHTRYAFYHNYLLCAGGYVAGDFRLFGAFPNKKYKFGYFPEFINYSIDELFENKRGQKKEEILIFWAARMIDWKHPELVLELAKILKNKNLPFVIEMAGGGFMEMEIRELIKTYHLENDVHLIGYLTPADTRKKMEEADIFLATSDEQEGWGAVINESMNSGCVVIANKRMGAAGYLLMHTENGIVYDKLCNPKTVNEIIEVIKQRDVRRKYAQNAYDTIANTWNPSIAAKRLYSMMKARVEHGEIPCYKYGPLSKG